MLEDKIINNNYNNVDFSEQCLSTSPIAVSPMVYDRYEESLSEDIGDMYVRKEIYDALLSIYENSEYYKKYGKDVKKLEKKDVADIYYSFKQQLTMNTTYSLVQIFCAIAEFFDLNYKTLYNDVISLEDKAQIIEILQETYGLENTISKSKRLF